MRDNDESWLLHFAQLSNNILSTSMWILKCKDIFKSQQEEIRREFLQGIIVPYNPYLLAKFDCSINVEIWLTIKAIKYVCVCVYIYKGHDRTSFYIVTNNSNTKIGEIKQYISTKLVSPTKVAWRIYKFSMMRSSPQWWSMCSYILKIISQ